MQKGFKTRKEDIVIPAFTQDIPKGDSPGDKVVLCEGHAHNTSALFPTLIEKLYKLRETQDKIVVSFYGGSGVGKSGIAALMSYYLGANGIKSYVMSGDNYPRRIPMYNDAERLAIFRKSGLKGLIAAGEYTNERFEMIQGWQLVNDDANPVHLEANSWFTHYLAAGRAGLAGYLGTSHEQDFNEVNELLKDFKVGKNTLYPKRFGRTETELWYEAVDFTGIEVLFLEWTHAGSDECIGVDIPVFLNSTPQETLEHRRARNRGDEIDSPFITMVLEIEQDLINAGAHKAEIILSKQGKIISYEQLQTLMQ